ncbi:hypothetical protein [Mycobacterium sp. AZCC_0083]|uniref:hypothetical protein n=1 Tax=Mycobacterium sp. AZCC_0083 TaxID=2735882 RepID=UPI0016165D3B|nr:hypothetical protein [Mycobacterium sp. AZCC_0083]MBB5167177.1 hypothetical protein [Mycobacterium sp. AZCC_0083]
MGTSVKREVSLSSPMTLGELREFYDLCRDMDIPLSAQLSVTVIKGYSDFRESWPDGVTITARP